MYMEIVKLQEIANGALQENAQKAIEEVVKNMQDPNTPWKNKREVQIKLKFTQNEDRDDCVCNIFVEKKLAPVKPLETKFALAKDLTTGEVFANEYGRGLKGQMKLDDYSPTQVLDGQVIDTDTGEVLEDTVVDFKKVRA